MGAALSVVADSGRKAPKPQETVAERVRRLQRQAKAAAKSHVRALCASLAEVEQMAAEIAEGGEVYPPGIRDLARRLAEDTETRAKAFEAILSRNG